jgi:hypothetical protein
LEISLLITCQLTKLETALEQIRKAYPKLAPTDAAIVASALSLAGRHAIVLYDNEQYTWPEDYSKLTAAMSREMEQVQESIEPTVKKTKTTVEEEPITVSVGLMPNLSAGEKLMENHENLKAILSDALQKGVEFVYSPSDIMWQWALDRANWSTIAGKEISRRVRVKATFTEGAVGVEMGTGTTRKRATKASKAAPEVEVDVDVPEILDPIVDPALDAVDVIEKDIE